MIWVFFRRAMCQGAAADEEDVLGVHMDELLLRVLAAALGRDVHHTAFQQLQQGLLHAFTGHVAGDGGVVALAGNLVYLVDEHDAALRLHLVKIGLLEKAREDALHVFAHVAGLREHGGVHDGERNVQKLGDGAGQQRLSRTGGAYQEDVALFQLHPVLGLLNEVVLHPLVMVVHRHGQHLLGAVLANHVLVQIVFDFLRLGGRTQFGGGLALPGHSPFGLVQVLRRQAHAVGADVAVQALQQERHFGPRPAAEHAVLVLNFLGHANPYFLRLRISSTMP